MFQIDWSQFVPSLVGTGLGCLLAIILTRGNDWIRGKQEQRKVEKEILLELKDIHSRVAVNYKNRHEMSSTRYYLEPYRIPVFSGLVFTYKLKKFMKKELPLLVDGSIEAKGNAASTSILSVYDSVIEVNTWHTWRTNHLNDPIALSISDKYLDAIEKELQYEIESVLCAMGGEELEVINE